MSRRLLIHCCYALLLLFAQQAALTHAAWHARSNDTPQHEHSRDQTLQAELCKLHGAFCQVLGGVDASVPQPLPDAAVFVPIDCRYEDRCTTRLFTPPARGPPALS